MTTPAYLLGIDAGTTVIKSTLFDLNGREFAGGSQDSSILHPRPDWAEADMELVWAAVVATIRQTLARAAVEPGAIAAIGVTGQGDGTWLVDAARRPVRPAILWSDGRTAALVQELHRTGVSAEVFRITGTALNTCNQAVQLRWLQEHEPETRGRTIAALRAKDWIFLQLTSEISTDETDASHTYFDVRRRTYDPRILQLLGVEDWQPTLPPAHPAPQNRGTLLPAVARELGLPPRTPVVGGPFDVVASAVGVGAVAPGDACTILGTAGIHLFVLDQPVSEPENVGYTICHAPADRLLRLLPTMTSTVNLQWFVREFFRDEWDTDARTGRNVWDRLEALAQEAPVGANGVMYHPYIDPAGERAPFVSPAARAQFTGLSLHHRRQDLLRAVYEGVVLSALDCYALMPMAVSELKLAGGGARSPLWAQMFADALGCPVTVAAGVEFGAKGAALNAGIALGLYTSFPDAVAKTVHPGRRYEPDLSKQSAYVALLAAYRATRDAMLPVWRHNAQLLERLETK